MRKFCQICKAHNFAAPKPAFCLPSSPLPPDRIPTLFPILHTIERGELLQGRGNLGDTPSVLPLRVKPHSPFCRYATSSPGAGEVVPQGDGFSSGGKVSGIAIRRPLGGAGCERSEQTEGVSPGKRPAPSQALPRQLSQRESQAVKSVAKVLGAKRNFPAVDLALPLGELSKPQGFD